MLNGAKEVNVAIKFWQQLPIYAREFTLINTEGKNPADVLKDEEGVQIMRTLGRNMAWILKSIEAGKKAGIEKPTEEDKIFTNYIN